MIHILLVEDDKNLNAAIGMYLRKKGMDVTGCMSAMEAYDSLYAGTYDLIISDIMMADIDGFEFAKTVREENKDIPILFMSARGDFSFKEKGFMIGIDDYMVKPIDLNELALRIQALLRRANIAAEKEIVLGNMVMREDEASVTLDGEEIPLTLREFQILFKLLSYPKKVFTRSQLLDEFYGIENESGLRSIDTHITNIRSKIARCDAFEIVTVRGLGYKAVIK